MINLTKEQIKEIAEELDLGFKCYLHKTNHELVFLPDTDQYPDMDFEGWAEDIDKVEENFSDYIEIEPLTSTDKFQIMVDFVETLSEKNKLKHKLIDVLNKSKPFRNFKHIIENEGEYREYWFEFKNKKNQEWVVKEIEYINSLDAE